MNKEIWKQPQEESSLDQAQCPLWFWNDKLEKNEILRQLKMKTEVGVTCTNPHARSNFGEGFIGGYLDEEWFEHIRTVLEYKEEHQEPVWLYDEMDWPAGTCNKTITRKEENREQYLSFYRITIPAGKAFRAQLFELSGKGMHGLEQGSDMSEFAFNVFIYDEETGKPYEISDYFKYLLMGPELEFISEQDAVAYVVKIHVDAYDQEGSMQVNYLDKSATGEFLASTYDKYYERFPEYFGSTIQCVFNDETRMCNPLPWSREFPEVFKEQKDYDIMKHLPELVIPGENAGRIRCDYFDVLAYLYQENYFGEIHKWCKEHKVNLFAHLLGEETMFGHARYSGDYLRQNKYLDIPGADHLGKGIGSLNIKYTSTGAHSYGKDMTAVEVFAGCGWDMTFEEYIRMITWMFQQGMRIIINHGFFYSDRDGRKNDWPPSQFFQWQGWNRMKEGNAMVRRLHYGMTDGVSEADVLMYHPIESFWLHYQPDLLYTHGFMEGAFLGDDEAVRMDREMQLLMNGLLSENLDFELLHKDALDNFRAEGGKIKNIKNGQEFSVLILPMCKVLPAEAARFCKTFAEQGGRIILVDQMPKMALRKSEDEEVVSIFEDMKSNENFYMLELEEKEALYTKVREVIPHPIEIVKGTAKTINNHPAYPSYLIDPYVHTGEDLTGVQFARYLKDGKRNTLFMNYGKEPETVWVKAESNTVPEIWDTFTGEIVEANVVEKEEEMYTIQLQLPCNYGVFVVCS